MTDQTPGAPDALVEQICEFAGLRMTTEREVAEDIIAFVREWDAATAAAAPDAALVASRDRLARAYILLCEYTYGTKRANAFMLHISAHQQVTESDLAAVRDEVWAEIEKLPDDTLADYEKPDEDEER